MLGFKSTVLGLKNTMLGLKRLTLGLKVPSLGLRVLTLSLKAPCLILWAASFVRSSGIARFPYFAALAHFMGFAGLVGLVSLVGLVGCDKPPAKPKPLPHIVWHSCDGVDITGVTSRCGRYYPYINSSINSISNKKAGAQLDSSKVNNPQLFIAFTILTPSNSPAYAAPVVFMAGGPGEGGNTQGIKLERWRYWLLDNPIKRPLIVWDSRGNQGAWGYFECESYRLWSLNQLTQITQPESENQERAQLQACVERWRQMLGKQSFQSFNSEQNARDILGALTALEYDSWHVLSVSYGSRVAQWLAVLAPKKTKSLLLDSPYSWQTRTLADHQQYWWQGFERFFDICDKRKHCAGAKPMAATFDAAIKAIDENPLALKFKLDGYQYSAVITAETFAHLLFTLLYDPHHYSQVTSLLAYFAGQQLSAAQAGSDNILSQLLAQSYAKTANPWLYWLTQCNDNDISHDFAAKHVASHNQIPAKWRRFLIGNTQAVVCELTAASPKWQPPKVTSDTGNIQTDNTFLPAVILSGGLDPVTPVASAYEVAQDYQSVLLQAPNAGHGLLLNDACLNHGFYDYWQAPMTFIYSLRQYANAQSAAQLNEYNVPAGKHTRGERGQAIVKLPAASPSDLSFDVSLGTSTHASKTLIKKGCSANFFNLTPLPGPD